MMVGDALLLYLLNDIFNRPTFLHQCLAALGPLLVAAIGLRVLEKCHGKRRRLMCRRPPEGLGVAER